MNITYVRDLALKLFGIFYLLKSAINFSQLIGMLNTLQSDEPFDISPLYLVQTAIIPLTLWLIIGIMLTLRTATVQRILWSRRQSDEVASLITVPPMSFWIVLICFYFIISAIGGASSELYVLIAKPEWRHLVKQVQMSSHIITIIFSVLCIFKAEVIGNWLSKRISKGDKLSNVDQQKSMLLG
eukprot:TRINITY_DN10031_c0_g1_i3.p2 TRINITY_DN10031_c0_g1~~TRINITY_DN10031_c0_g1_i3.p2  ORF type:complete len:184 (+),score=1.76 TRINITY_DN10031_c0_g1_i3:165-716(+)